MLFGKHKTKCAWQTKVQIKTSEQFAVIWTVNKIKEL